MLLVLARDAVTKHRMVLVATQTIALIFIYTHETNDIMCVCVPLVVAQVELYKQT